MRKKIFFGLIIVLVFCLLIMAFENIQVQQQFWFLFFQWNSSATMVVLFSGLLGFLIGFFAMLYSHEVRREALQAADQEVYGAAPAAQEEKKEVPSQKAEAPAKEPEKPAEEPVEKKLDPFDEDDEVLG